MPPGEPPAGDGGAGNCSQGQQQQHGGRLRVFSGCVSLGTDGDRHWVVGPQRPLLGIIGNGVSIQVQKISFLPSHVSMNCLRNKTIRQRGAKILPSLPVKCRWKDVV